MGLTKRRQSREEFIRPSQEFLDHLAAKKAAEAERKQREAEAKAQRAAAAAERKRLAQEEAERRIADRVAAQILKGHR